MKIALVNSLYWPHRYGGAERSVQSLAERLANQGDEVHVHTLDPKRDNAEHHHGVEVHRHKIRNLFWPFDKTVARNRASNLAWHLRDARNGHAARSLASSIAHECYDVVHTNNLAGFSIELLHQLGRTEVPLVHTARDYYGICLHTDLHRGGNCNHRCMKCLINRRIKSLHHCRVDAFVGLSDRVVKLYQDANAIPPQTSVHVVANGIDAAPMELEPKPQSEPNVGFDDTVTLGFLGTLAPVKGVQQLLCAHQRLPCDVKLIVAGTGDPEFTKSLHDEHRRENVRFVGQIDATQFFAKIDVLVVPSIWEEPFGRVVIESYHAKVPVVASAHGALPELVDEGQTGWVNHGGDVDGLVQTLRLAISQRDQWPRYSLACAEAAKRYTVDIMASNYRRIYESVIRSSTRIGISTPTESVT